MSFCLEKRSVIEYIPDQPYVITGIFGVYDDVYERTFVAIDSDSGYPYWTNRESFARRFKTVQEANEMMRMVKHALEHVHELSICKMTILFHPLPEMELTDQLKQAALAKLTAEERKLLGLE